jgi:two-component system sensor histidine kinase KdpD
LAVAAVVAVTLIATPLRDTLELANIVMLFLLAVLFAAFKLGRGPALLASFLSVAAFDFFFVLASTDVRGPAMPNTWSLLP